MEECDEHKLISGLKIDHKGSFEDFVDEFEKIFGVRPQQVFPELIPTEMIKVYPLTISTPAPINYCELISDFNLTQRK